MLKGLDMGNFLQTVDWNAIPDLRCDKRKCGKQCRATGLSCAQREELSRNNGALSNVQ